MSHPLLNSLLSLILQGIAVLAVSALGILQTFVILTLHVFIVLVGASLLQFPRTWLIGNGLIPLMALGLSITSSNWPGHVALGALVLLLLIFAPTLIKGVPFFPTNRAAFNAIELALPNDDFFSFVDLGSGMGTLLFHLAHRYPEASFVGYEIGPLPYFWSKVISYWYPNVTIRYQSFWSENLAPFDIVYAFLSPVVMERLENKLKKELREKGIFMSLEFPLPKWLPQSEIVFNLQGTKILVYER
jgi:hypothetical protein